jgi:hypothetical protein
MCQRNSAGPPIPGRRPTSGGVFELAQAACGPHLGSRAASNQHETRVILRGRMTPSKIAVSALLDPVLDWLKRGGDAWQMDLAYWERRRRLMAGGEMLSGDASTYLSSIDTAMDAFNPDPDRHSLQIDEAQLRGELARAIGTLRTLGYLTDEE